MIQLFFYWFPRIYWLIIHDSANNKLLAADPKYHAFISVIRWCNVEGRLVDKKRWKAAGPFWEVCLARRETEREVPLNVERKGASRAVLHFHAPPDTKMASHCFPRSPEGFPRPLPSTASPQKLFKRKLSFPKYPADSIDGRLIAFTRRIAASTAFHHIMRLTWPCRILSSIFLIISEAMNIRPTLNGQEPGMRRRAFVP